MIPSQTLKLYPQIEPCQGLPVVISKHSSTLNHWGGPEEEMDPLKPS